MWKFSSSNSSYTLWPPDTAQKQKSTSLAYPTFVNNSGCFSENSIAPFPGLGAQGCFFHLNSSFIQQLNLQALDTANETLGVEFTTGTKKFLIFDQSGDRTSLVANPTLPATNANYAYVPNAHDTEEMVEMHEEDTEEIDALLNSDSEFSYDSEESSTGHSPLVLEDEEIASPSIPSKHRRLNLSELDVSVMDSASSARVPSHHFITDDDNVAELSYVKDSSGEAIMSGKRKRSIQTTLNVLRRIIPGGKGKGKDAASVLDEAILYLKYLMLQAKALGVSTTNMYN